jgi:PTH1 family peptidyl-tRNA hydrolase
MQSIIEALGSQQFARLRIGIGRPLRGEPQEYVLSGFTPAQAAAMEDTYQRAVAAAALFVAKGTSLAMNNANA